MALTNEELLQAISTMIDQKLEPISGEISDMKGEISDMKGEISGIKSEISDMKNEMDNMKSQMVTKSDLQASEQNLKNYVDQRLRESENMILNEVDRVQEKTNEKFNNLKLRVM